MPYIIRFVVAKIGGNEAHLVGVGEAVNLGSVVSRHIDVSATAGKLA